MTAIGFAFDAGSGGKELTMAFAALYFIGCVVAALAVRQSGIFTAVIQPPLILFVAVPTAYFLFHGGQLTGVKDTLINCGYPLIERFPLMFFTSATVLLIGIVRWLLGRSTGGAAEASTAAKDTTGGGLTSTVTSKVSSLLKREPDEDDADANASPRRRRTTDRPSRAAGNASGASRSGKPSSRATPSRSRHARPPETEIIEPVLDRPRRPRPTRQSEPPPVPPGEPRRRPRTSSNPRRSAPPPADGRVPYDERRRRFDDYEPLEPHGTNGNGTHHPISRVRYRAADEGDDRAQHRSRPRRERAYEPENWKYDA